MTFSFPDGNESYCQGPFPAGPDLWSYHHYVGKQYTHTHTVNREGAIVSTVEASQYSAQTNPPPSYLQPEGPQSDGNSIRQTLPRLTTDPEQNHFLDVVLARPPAATSPTAGASQEPGGQASWITCQPFVAF